MERITKKFKEAIYDIIDRNLFEVMSKDYPNHILNRIEDAYTTGTINFRLNSGQPYLVKKGQDIIGFAIAEKCFRYFSGEGELSCCHIRDLFVLPEYQGLGIGKLLMDQVINDFSDLLGCETAHLNSSIGAQGFYRKLGFIKGYFDGVSYSMDMLLRDREKQNYNKKTKMAV